MYRFKLFNLKKEVPSNSDTNSIPFARSGHRIVCDASNMYSFGGYYSEIIYTEADSDTISSRLFQELWKYNFATHIWTLLPKCETIPFEVASVAVLYDGKTLIVYGGTGSPFGLTCSNKLYMCNPDSPKNYSGMRLVPTNGDVPPLYGQALVFHDGYLYTIGGTTGYDYCCDIHRLCLKTNIWEPVYICSGIGDYEPEGRYRHEVAFDGKRIYVLGGGTKDNPFDFRYIPSFSLETNTWERLCTTSTVSGRVPHSRMCHGCVQHKSTTGDIQVFIVGGYNGVVAFNDIWRLDLGTLNWTVIRNCILPERLYFHSAALTPSGKMYVFGGICDVRRDCVRTNDILSVWLCVPKLSEMCWEAILCYNPAIANVHQNKLLNLGIPVRFVDRLQ